MTFKAGPKAISLISGGLDSALSTKLVLEQGVDVVGLHFTSPFSSRRDREMGLQAAATAEELGIRLMVREKGADYLHVLRQPKYGYGKNMNPCIDCRIFMLRKTGEIMAEERADFVITGEVLGQRPMSQMRNTLRLIEKESGLESLILRPLSAKHFVPTKPEREGIVDRERLLGIAGRSRAVQYELAAKYNLTAFGCPGGGCLLTDPIFSNRLRDLFAHETSFTALDVELLNTGRHFRIDRDTKLVLGRNQGENERLRSLWYAPYVLLQPVGFSGPAGIFKGSSSGERLTLAASIMAYYGKQRGTEICLEVNNGSSTRHRLPRNDVNVDTYKV
jgi:tRNA-uridine 2-sulfurtransferase